MKTRFSTLDIIAILPELRAKLCTGWRVNQIYDCDYKTYLFKLNKSIVQMKKDDDPVSVDEETANKMTLIIESGMRMHTTDYDWPKSHAPSQFSTKLRKHIRNKRIENITQVGADRLVDFQFGTNLAAIHLIVELYDKGNLILTDHNYAIIAILRWRRPTTTAATTTTDDQQGNNNVDSQYDSESFKIGQIYPLHLSKKQEDLEPMTETKICEMLNSAKILLGSNQNYKKRNKVKQNDQDGTLEINLKDLFNPYVVYGSSLLEDRLLEHISKGENARKCIIKIASDAFGKLDQEQVKHYAGLIKLALDDADKILTEVRERKQSPGFIVQKKQTTDTKDKKQKLKQNNGNENNDESKSFVTNVDFFPILSCAKRKIQQESSENFTYQEYESFDKALDVYYSNLESQKLDSKTMNAEREAMKKLDNLKISQEKRLDDLARVQKEDEEKGRLIELNCDKIENALLIIRSMIANQIPWSDIWNTIREAQAMNDPIASLITQVKFNRNEFTMRLCDPYDENEDEEEQCDNDERGKSKNKISKKANRGQGSKYRSVDIDISLSAYANARRFFTRRRTAVNKEKKTIEVSKKAYKNVERQTKQKLKEVVTTTNITKARKRYWFENFFWFISSDGFLVVAGRDAEQNELLVKRYMKNNDIYVHADLHGAATVIIKNETSEPVPPKTLTEAGSMAVCYSSAWDSKIATTSWWVYPKQVSKSAPTGEYLTVGAFIIRGKKNYLPLSNLVLGFGFLFRLEDESIERRVKERLAREHNFRQNCGPIAESDENSREPASRDSPEVSDNESIGDGEDVDDSSDNDDDNGAAEQDAVKELAQKKVVVGDPSDQDAHVENEDNNDYESRPKSAEDHEEDDDDDDIDDEDTKTTEHRLIDTLTESPTSDDVLLYAISMCGPYSALQNFKYKVKVIPGSNKRGKAAKTCLTMFLHDKRALQRERDLLRALKDQDYARNIPNKVKVSAPNMKNITKKRPKKSEVRLPMS